jgi:exopolysaccharide production protein ExoY
LKRVADVVVSLFLLIALSPMMLMISVLIRVLLQEWPISRHELVGANGRRFTGFRFRTMPANAEEILRRYLLSDPDTASEWRETRNLRNDPRLGCLGRVLTQSGLDDMPQLFSVLRGDMSIIGPRPVAFEEQQFRSTFGVLYPQARPGMTGLWRVDVLGQAAQARHGMLDRYYARRWSFRLDCWILLRTIPALLNATPRSS